MPLVRWAFVRAHAEAPVRVPCLRSDAVVRAIAWHASAGLRVDGPSRSRAVLRAEGALTLASFRIPFEDPSAIFWRARLAFTLLLVDTIGAVSVSKTTLALAGIVIPLEGASALFRLFRNACADLNVKLDARIATVSVWA